MSTLDHALSPMLVVDGDTPPSGPGWAFGFKWDGMRALVTITDTGVARVTNRRGRDVTRSYPELGVLGGLGEWCVLDGEIVALDAHHRPDFGSLQKRIFQDEPSEKILTRIPVFFFAFDVLTVGGVSLLRETYDRRREVLTGLGVSSPTVSVPPEFTDTDGPTLLGVVDTFGMEGIVAKRRDSPYRPGCRPPYWVKTVLRTTSEVVIGGWRTGANRELGALMVGAYNDLGELVYWGDVGSGFTEDTLRHLHMLLTAREEPRSPFSDCVRPGGAHWVRPDLVGEIRSASGVGRVRHAVWRGLRSDKQPREVVMVQ